MPTLTQILYALFILICIVLVGWFLLEIIDRMDEAFIRLMLGGWS